MAGVTAPGVASRGQRRNCFQDSGQGHPPQTWCQREETVTERKAAPLYCPGSKTVGITGFSGDSGSGDAPPGPPMEEGSEAGFCRQKLSKENPHFLSFDKRFLRRLLVLTIPSDSRTILPFLLHSPHPCGPKPQVKG